MIKKMLFIILGILFVQSATAAEIGLIASFPDGSVHGQCIITPEGSNGYDVMQKVSLDLLWAGPGSFGHQLCKLNNIGDDVTGDTCEYSGKYWGFLKSDDSAWQYMPVGFDGGSECWNDDLSSYAGHYCAKDKDVIGLRYGEFGELPPYYSFADICEPLSLNDIKVYVDGKKQSADEDGGTIKAGPESTIEFKIEVENDYQFDASLEVEDIEAIVILKDVDDGDDLEEDIDFRDLDTGKKDREEVSFNLPLLLEDGKHDAHLELTAKTRSGITQKINIDYSLKIKKERHDLVLSKAELSSEESCPGDSNSLEMKLVNLGRSDEEVSLKVVNPELSVDYSNSFEIENGNDKDSAIFVRDIPFLIPETAQAGQYPINVLVSYAEEVKETVLLSVKDCSKNNVILENVPAFSQTAREVKPVTVSKTSEVKPIPQARQRRQQVVYEESFMQEFAVPIVLGSFLCVLVLLIITIGLMLRK